jgi:hypothetical protein
VFRRFLLVGLILAGCQIISTQPSAAGLAIVPIAPNYACGESTIENRICQPILRVQFQRTVVRAEVRAIRLRIRSGIGIILRKVTASIRLLGGSLRSAAEGARMVVARRLVASICCRLKIQSNLIYRDLSKKFPSATIKQDVQLNDQFGHPKHFTSSNGVDSTAIVDLIVDHSSLKIVFEDCHEIVQTTTIRPGGQSEQSEYVFAKDGEQETRIEVQKTQKLQACLKLDTGEITYRNIN